MMCDPMLTVSKNRKPNQSSSITNACNQKTTLTSANGYLDKDNLSSVKVLESKFGL